MGKAGKVIIILVLAAAVTVVMTAKNRSPVLPSVNQDGTDSSVTTTSPETNLPLLLDVGSKGCTPCTMMEPILAGLEADYEGKMEVVFIDVKEDSMAKEIYDIQMIPTQIFFDASGKELFRHEGFYSKEDILGKWKKLGVNIEKTQE